ncbi:MAG: hypothetical protein GEU74_01785 [Nitriliruptorales bacterium]|nr:hypothetical protein [Nitriliruptorales bacterium]
MKRTTAAIMASMITGASLLRARRHASTGAVGVVGTRLQTWIPPAPRSALTRLVAAMWASPVTLAGLLAGAGSATRPRFVDGIVLFAPARGITGLLIRRRGFTAAGLGHVVIALEEPSASLLAHELAHVRQAERLGPFMAPAYLALLAVHGYRHHPMERAARLAAERHATRR